MAEQLGNNDQVGTPTDQGGREGVPEDVGGEPLELSAHTLRHTALTNLVRSGADVVMVAEIGGHRRLDTVRRYSLPSEADKDAALEAVLVEI